VPGIELVVPVIELVVPVIELVEIPRRYRHGVVSSGSGDRACRTGRAQMARLQAVEQRHLAALTDTVQNNTLPEI
jgi:hypothetical protein